MLKNVSKSPVRFETWFYGEYESFNVVFTWNNITFLLLLIQMCAEENKPSSQERYFATDGCTCTYMQPNHGPLSFTLTF